MDRSEYSRYYLLRVTGFNLLLTCSYITRVSRHTRAPASVSATLHHVGSGREWGAHGEVRGAGRGLHGHEVWESGLREQSWVVSGSEVWRRWRVLVVQWLCVHVNRLCLSLSMELLLLSLGCQLGGGREVRHLRVAVYLKCKL